MAKRLHALSAEKARKVANALLLIVLALIASCNREKPQTPSAQAPAATESTVKGKPMQIIDLEGVEGAPLASKLDLLGLPGVTESSGFSVGFRYVTVFDETRNAFVRKYKLKQPKASIRGVVDYYLVGDKLYGYGAMVAPNKRIAIYPQNGINYSVYINPETNDYYVISSKDLIKWDLTSISTSVPILLYRMNGDLFAIAEDKVFRVENACLVREIPLPTGEGHGQYYLNAKDRSIFYSYGVDDVLAVHYRRDFEDGQGEFFLTISLNDFSYTRNSSEKVIKIGEYETKAVRRADGWKVYYVARDPELGIKVLDPLANGGPAIVETLPGAVVQ